MQIDPEAAQAWLLSMLPNPELDPAIKEAIKRLLPTDPDASMAWVQRLDDEDAAPPGVGSRGHPVARQGSGGLQRLAEGERSPRGDSAEDPGGGPPPQQRGARMKREAQAGSSRKALVGCSPSWQISGG